MKGFVIAHLLLGASMLPVNGEDVEILRDQWGIAHVYADREDALFFGAGYAAAEDRMFQMMLKRREALGRLSEILGPGPDRRFVQSDRLARTLGLEGVARRKLARMDPEARLQLEAFAAGVNAYLKEKRGRLFPLFDRYGGHPEPWRAVDSVAIWDFKNAQFSSGWKQEAAARQGPQSPPAEIDDEAAVVSEEEFRRSYPDVYRRLKEIGRGSDLSGARIPPGWNAPKASQNWVVSGRRSKTGKPILESDPQLKVQNPNSFYEIHLTGGRYNIRGAAFVGTPAFLIGFTDRIGWGGTGLNLDQADLFEEKIRTQDGLYQWKGEWKKLEKRTEVIQVKGSDPVRLEVTETHHGPVVTDLLEGVGSGENFSLKAVFLDPGHCSLSALLEMARATDWRTFRQATAGYVGPGIHIIYADREGNIAYQSAGHVPIRTQIQTVPLQGWTGEQEWEPLPFEMMASMLNPQDGYITTANNLPIGSWHPYAVSNSLGGGPRSWRLKEIFSEERKYSVDDFIRIVHQDSVTPALRDFAYLALQLAEEVGVQGEEAAAAALLRNWDGQMKTDSPAFGLAWYILRNIEKSLGADWIMGYGGSWPGMMKLLRSRTAEARQKGRLTEDPELRTWLMETLRAGYQDLQKKGSPAQAAGMIHRMPYQNNDAFGSLAPEYDLSSPPLISPEVHTIWSQAGGTYVHIVDFSNLDASLAMMATGVSENPSSPHHTDQMTFWKEGTLRAAPISRPAVEALKKSVKTLRYSAP